MLVHVGGRARGPGAGPHDPPADAHRAGGDREGHQRKEEGRVAVHGRVSAYRNTPGGDPTGGWLPHLQRWWSCGRCSSEMPVASWAMSIPDENTPALRLLGVRKTFEAADAEQVPVRALRGIDLEIAPGAFVAI